MSGREYEKTVQEPGTLAILDKYKDQYFPGDLALPVISNQKMNQYLKEICELCGRKTFICFMLSIGLSPP